MPGFGSVLYTERYWVFSPSATIIQIFLDISDYKSLIILHNLGMLHFLVGALGFSFWGF